VGIELPPSSFSLVPLFRSGEPLPFLKKRLCLTLFSALPVIILRFGSSWYSLPEPTCESRFPISSILLRQTFFFLGLPSRDRECRQEVGSNPRAVLIPDREIFFFSARNIYSTSLFPTLSALRAFFFSPDITDAHIEFSHASNPRFPSAASLRVDLPPFSFSECVRVFDRRLSPSCRHTHLRLEAAASEKRLAFRCAVALLSSRRSMIKVPFVKSVLLSLFFRRDEGEHPSLARATSPPGLQGVSSFEKFLPFL